MAFRSCKDIQQQDRTSSPAPQEVAAGCNKSSDARIPMLALRHLNNMGVAQLVIGALVFILGIVNAVVGAGQNLAVIGSVILSGFFCIVAGISGLVAGRGAKGCSICGCIISCLVFNVFSAGWTLGALVVEAMALSGCRFILDHPSYFRLSAGITNDAAFRRADCITCCVLLALELVATIVQLVFACRAFCRASSCCAPEASHLLSGATNGGIQQQALLAAEHQEMCVSDRPPVICTDFVAYSFSGQSVPGCAGQHGPSYQGQQPPTYSVQVVPSYPEELPPAYKAEA